MADNYDYIIVGSGIAGLYAALLAREHGSVLVLTKGSIDDCNTRWAQGGIAAPVGPDDSPEKHLRDTIIAGAGLVDEEAARVLTSEAADRIRDLVRFGVPFDTVHGEVALAREGAHSVPRVLHAGGDSTGMHIELTLSSVARHEGVTVLEYTIATEILVGAHHDAPQPLATGVRAQNTQTGERTDYTCRHLVLATGGAGQMYRVSTNPPVATGDGIALAYRAGAEITDMEFIQFHPTALKLPGVQSFLISEAVRGEGGILRDTNGARFMPEYDERAELAPRDIVARAIRDRMQKTGGDHVLLDVTHLEAQLVAARFPQIYRFCLDAGLDITREPIPVSPAAHYTMGGIRTNTWGETTIPGLYACGECACTGVHGANRLASNSLLETVVFAKRVIARTLESPETSAPETEGATDLSPAALPVRLKPDPPELSRTGPTEGKAPHAKIQALDDVGIVRDAAGLTCAKTPPRGRRNWKHWRPPSQEVADLDLLAAGDGGSPPPRGTAVPTTAQISEPREEWRRHLAFTAV